MFFWCLLYSLGLDGRINRDLFGWNYFFGRSEEVEERGDEFERVVFYVFLGGF